MKNMKKFSLRAMKTITIEIKVYELWYIDSGWEHNIYLFLKRYLYIVYQVVQNLPFFDPNIWGTIEICST